MTATNIEHVVVLMMENHSFDHLLGYRPGSSNGQATTPTDCTTGSTPIPITDDAADYIPLSPGHSVGDTNQQLFCVGNPDDELPPDAQATLAGFVANYQTVMAANPTVTAAENTDVTKCFGSGSTGDVPTNLWSLADQYAVCDQWFASVPGPTTPNRLFANCASSGGYAGNAYELDDLPAAELCNMPSIFSSLQGEGYTWAVFHEDEQFVPEKVLSVVQSNPQSCVLDQGLKQFFDQVQNGVLANYTFLTPSLGHLICPDPGNDSQHPPGSVKPGDDLIGAVYSAIHGCSTLWANTLLLIVYDEHGGFYDGVVPPTGIVDPGPYWDSGTWPKIFTPPSFHFDRLGVRVPAVVVSAYTAQQTDSTQYEHSSIVSTVREIFGITAALNARDESAHNFANLISDTRIH